jgi:enoyl-[acyl-carrier protein] reductase I
MISSGLLHGKKGIVFGALDEASIAWAVAEAAFRENAQLVLTNAPVTKRFGQLETLAGRVGDCPVIYADATDSEELEGLFSSAMQHFGAPVDFVVHSIGMGLNVRKNRPYTNLKYEWYHKTLDISAISLHRAITAGLEKDALAEGASIVTLSYIGAQRTFSKYSEMGDAKALLESIVRSYGYRLGKKRIRINAVSQSPTRTTAGSGIAGFDAMFEFADRISPLGNADAASCADYVLTLLSDMTRMVTMQTLYHDGGFSAMGISDETVELLGDALVGKENSD